MDSHLGRSALDSKPRRRRFASPVLYGLFRTLRPRLLEAHGSLLDAGCGLMPYRYLVEQRVSRYDGIDLAVTKGIDIRYRGTITEMPEVGSDTYDFVLCSEVLEHLSAPWLAVAEIERVLKPGGSLVLSVPFLSRLHDEPHDYFRFTSHGLKSLVEASGMNVDEIVPYGSIFSFLGHQAASLVISATFHIPVLGWLGLAVNWLIFTLPGVALDSVLGRAGVRLPAGYVVRATKQAASSQ